MSDTRPTSHYYNKLTEPYRTQAINSFIDQFGRERFETSTANSIADAIDRFSWGASEQGSSYWSNIHTVISHNPTYNMYTARGVLDAYIPDWLKSRKAILDTLSNTYKFPESSMIVLCIMCSSNRYTDEELVNAYYGEELNHKKTLALYCHTNCTSRRKGSIDDYFIHTKDGVRILYKVSNLKKPVKGLDFPEKK